MKSILVSLLLCLVSLPALCENKTGIYYGLYTDHIFSPEEYNEDNHVFLIQHNNFYSGTFLNSHYERSYIFAWSFWDYRKVWNNRYFFEFDAAVGAATGYEGHEFTIGPIAPSVLGALDFGITHKRVDYGIRTVYTPLNVINMGLFLNFKY